ncbi:WD40 repeat domain-containing protein [Singulisphaera rosea]
MTLWDARTGHASATLRGHVDAIEWVAFSADGKMIATASRDTTVKVWDVPKVANP